MDESTLVLYRVILERYVKVIWTHKIHLCQASIYYRKKKSRGTFLTLLSCAVSAAAITNVLSWLPTGIIVPVLATLSLVLTFFTIKFKSDNLEKAAIENEHFAATMHDLRNRYEGLLADIKSGMLTKSEIISKRELLEREENLIYSGIVPFTSSDAVVKAGRALKLDQDSTTTEGEIDLLVSENLKIK